MSLGFVHAPNVGLKNRVTLLHPIDWIGRFETRQLGAIELPELDSRKAHEEARKTIREPVLAVRCDGHDHGIGPASLRSV